MLYVCCMCVVCVLYDVVCTLYVEHFKTATKTPTQNDPRSQPHHHEDAACMLNASKLASVCYATRLPEWRAPLARHPAPRRPSSRAIRAPHFPPRAACPPHAAPRAHIGVLVRAEERLKHKNMKNIQSMIAHSHPHAPKVNVER